MEAHKEKANEILDGLFTRDTGVAVIAAQVHATLALAEQQRIANLIALEALAEAKQIGGAIPDYITKMDDRGDLRLNPEIKNLLEA